MRRRVLSGSPNTYRPLVRAGGIEGPRTPSRRRPEPGSRPMASAGSGICSVRRVISPRRRGRCARRAARSGVTLSGHCALLRALDEYLGAAHDHGLAGRRRVAGRVAATLYQALLSSASRDLAALDEAMLYRPSGTPPGHDLGEPCAVGVVQDAYLAAVAEHLAECWRLRCPDWVHGVRRFLQRPFFAGGLENLKAALLVESPVAFRRRMLFVGRDVLDRPRRFSAAGRQ